MRISSLGNLRQIEDCEIETIRSWRNAPAVRKNMYTTHVISKEEHETWWQQARSREDQKHLIYEQNGRSLGVVGFSSISYMNKNCFWAFYASPDAPRGTGSKMEFLALEFAFRKLKLHKLSCEVLDFNKAVVKLHRKFGFIVEGTFRQQHRVGEDYADIIRLGIFKSEWQDRRPLIEEGLTNA